MTTKQELPDDDDEAAAAIVQRLKSQGVFDSMRRECLADIDTKPAFLNLSQRIERYVSNFLDRQEWRQDLNKNQLRERLRRNLTDSNMMKYGIDHLVDGAVQAKRRTFMPEVEKVVKDMLGIEDEAEEVQWPDARELKSEPDVDNSQQDMDVDDDSNEDREVTVKSENFIPSFVEVNSSSQSSSSPVQSKSIIQQLFEPVVRKEDERTLTPTKISIQLNFSKQLAEAIKSDETQTKMEPDEGDVIETVDMEEDSRPSSKNSISDIQLPSSPPPTLPGPPPLRMISEEEEGENAEIDVVAEPSNELPIKIERKNDEAIEDVDTSEIPEQVGVCEEQIDGKKVDQLELEETSQDEAPPLEYLSDVSSVHTSDLSDFDNQISPDSSDEERKSSPKKKPEKIQKARSRKSKDAESSKRRSADNRLQNTESRPSTGSSTGRRERKINPKYASDEYTSIYNIGNKGNQTIEEDISSDEDFDVEAESTASKSTPVQDELSNCGSSNGSKKADEGDDDVVLDASGDQQNKSQLKSVKRKVSRRQERYDASDLYKPRPVIGSSRRNRNANSDQT